MTMTTMTMLSPDELVMVFQWLPLQRRQRSRLVCRDWNDIIRYMNARQHFLTELPSILRSNARHGDIYFARRVQAILQMSTVLPNLTYIFMPNDKLPVGLLFACPRLLHVAAGHLDMETLTLKGIRNPPTVLQSLWLTQECSKTLKQLLLPNLLPCLQTLSYNCNHGKAIFADDILPHLGVSVRTLFCRISRWNKLLTSKIVSCIQHLHLYLPRTMVKAVLRSPQAVVMFKDLRHLSVKTCKYQNLESLLTCARMPRLTSVNVTGPDCASNFVRQLLGQQRRLQSLTCAGGWSPAVGLTRLPNEMEHDLRILNVPRGWMDGSSLRSIASGYPFPRLEQLRLTDTESCFTPADVMFFLNSRFARQLQVLHLVSCEVATPAEVQEIKDTLMALKLMDRLRESSVRFHTSLQLQINAAADAAAKRDGGTSGRGSRKKPKQWSACFTIGLLIPFLIRLLLLLLHLEIWWPRHVKLLWRLQTSSFWKSVPKTRKSLVHAFVLARAKTFPSLTPTEAVVMVSSVPGVSVTKLMRKLLMTSNIPLSERWQHDSVHCILREQQMPPDTFVVLRRVLHDGWSSPLLHTFRCYYYANHVLR